MLLGLFGVFLTTQCDPVIQSAHYINAVFFSIPCQPYSPNRVTSCTSRQHSELLGIGRGVPNVQNSEVKHATN